MRTRVKICGITRVDDAVAAIGAGADAIGLVFAPASPRYIDSVRARQICAAVPPFVCVVGLFMNAAPDAITAVLGDVPLDLLQFHGDESAKECARYGRPYIKAVPMGGGADIVAYAGRYDGAQGFLLDSHAAGGAGGRGKVFDWDAVPPTFNKPLVLAGGLNPDNVAEAIVRVRPYGVDVSSGVEAAKGIKDAAKLAAFMRGVRAGDDTNNRR